MSLYDSVNTGDWQPLPLPVQQTDKSGVARRGPLAVGGGSLTTAHNGPQNLSTPIYIDNSSVKTGVSAERFVWDVSNETQSGGYYRAVNPADVAPVFIPIQEGQIEIWAGGGLVRAKRPPREKLATLRGAAVIGGPVGGGRRGRIVRFSKGSRRRLMQTFGKVQVKAVPLFLTLTYPDAWPHDNEEWKRHLKMFLKRVRRKFPAAAGIWRLEPQKRQAPHYHLMVWGVSWADLQSWVNRAWFEVVNSGDENHLIHGADVGIVRSWRGARSYASKYLAKVDNNDDDSSCWAHPGRWWGVFGRESMPWAEKITVGVGRAESILFIRTMRRYAKLKSRDYYSLSIMVNDGSWWFDNLDSLTGWRPRD